jgi:hypothetical protein
MLRTRASLTGKRYRSLKWEKSNWTTKLVAASVGK